MQRKIVWHRRDLRTHDNAALAKAGEKAVPVYIFNPEWLENNLVSDSRIEFVLESLKDLNRQYVEKGSNLTLLYGNPLEKLSELQDEHEILFNYDSNHFNRQLEESAREKFTPVKGDAVKPGGRGENWSKHAEQWFRRETHTAPDQLQQNPLESKVTLQEVCEKHSVQPEKQKFGRGGTSRARNRLESFLERMDDYAGSISSPSKAEKKTSHLSPYIRYGCISPREVYRRAKEEKDSSGNPESVQMFIDRVVWQQHFRQKIEDNPELHRKAINPVYRELNYDNRGEEKIEAWKNGKTGFPLVDASMRALKQTGWLNFRMRAMCASFYSYILKQWWKEGADHFYRHLIDADVAINYYQWQMQSGLIGVHANRIYDPTKQVMENDPDGEFIRKYVPELRPVPDEYIAEPWKMPEELQEECRVRIGRNYPEPIVNYEREARKARRFFKKKAPEAYAAFRDDEVWRKASLSNRHSREEILEKAGPAQKDIQEFS